MQILPLSAKSNVSVRDQAFAFAKALRAGHLLEEHLADIAHTLVTGRQHFRFRIAVIASNHTIAAERFEAFARGFQSDAFFSGDVASGFVPDPRIEQQIQTLPLYDASNEILEALARWYITGYALPMMRPPPPASGRRLSLPTYRFEAKSYDKRDKGELVGEARSPAKQLAEASASAKPVFTLVESASPNIPIVNDRYFFCHRWSDALNDPVDEPIRPVRVLTVDLGTTSLLAASLARQHAREGSHCDHISLLELARGRSNSAIAQGDDWLDALLPEGETVDQIYVLDLPPDGENSNGLIRDCTEALTLIKTLHARERLAEKVNWFIVTSDAFDPSGAARPSALPGLGYWLAQSHSEHRIRNVDVSSRALTTLDNPVDTLVERIRSVPPSGRGDIVRIESNRRTKMIFPRLRTQEGLPSALSHGGVYVIAGGAGAVGSVLTANLIDQYKAKVIWIGRRGRDDPHISAAITAYGGNLTYIQGDLTDADQTRSMVLAASRCYGRLSGAIFAASQLETMSKNGDVKDKIHASAAVKQSGASNFYHALKDHGLDFLCYFSSIQAFSFTSALDTPGYAMGCAWTDSFVRGLVRAPFPVATINWGYWECSVRGTPWEERLHGRFGLLSDQEGVQAFDSFLRLVARYDLRQAIVMKCEEPVIELIGCDVAGEIQMRSSGGLSHLQDLWNVVIEAGRKDENGMAMDVR